MIFDEYRQKHTHREKDKHMPTTHACSLLQHRTTRKYLLIHNTQELSSVHVSRPLAKIEGVSLSRTERSVAEGDSKGYQCALSFPSYNGDYRSMCRPFMALTKLGFALLPFTRNCCEDRRSRKPPANHSAQISWQSPSIAKLLPLPQ